MSVRLQLDNRSTPVYTNLDHVSGRVILNLSNDTTISAINVKLEAESKTRLSGPRYPGFDRPDKQRTELEVHKARENDLYGLPTTDYLQLLYKVQTVFPAPELVRPGFENPQYTLPAGQYEYPFSLKLPFNNNCQNISSVFQDLKFGSLSVQLGPDTTRHVRQALPPTLGGFPGEADIRYYVKVTVVRPKFYLENLRAQFTIKFMPIEPPRPPDRGEETFARRQHQFQAFQSMAKNGLFRKTIDCTPDAIPLSFRVDARLPNPAVITCNQPLPLRILVEKLSDSPASICLTMLQIELIGFTNIRAHDLTRTETGSWIILSRANMNMVLERPAKKQNKEFKLPSSLWSNIPLPNTVCPSFDTCNISRKYELEVRVGVTHSTADNVRPELIVLPLRLPAVVYSGISPPAQLLDRLSTQPGASTLPTTLPTSTDLKAHSPLSPSSSDVPTPAYHDQPSPTINLAPPPDFAGGHDDDDDAPPSYEDALAEDLGPVDGPRRDYNSSPMPSHSTGDSKSSDGLRRHPSERLFAQNAPISPWSVGPRRETLADTTSLDDDDDAPELRPALPERPRQDSSDAVTQLVSDVAIATDHDTSGEHSQPKPDDEKARIATAEEGKT